MGLAVCPNKSHPNYKQLVDIFRGDDDLALYVYDLLGERIPSDGELTVIEKGGTLTNYHNQRVWNVNKAEGLITDKWSTVDGLRTVESKPMYKKTAENKAEELKKKYYVDKIGFTVQPSTTEKGRYVIKPYDKLFAGGDQASKIHVLNNQVREELESGAIIENIDEEGNVLPDESRKLNEIQTKPETKAGLKEKIEVLRKTIPWVETIEYDENLPTVATVVPGGKMIIINPNLMTTDSIGHEYGHVFIDMLGGMASGIIRQAREQLRGTAIEKAVMEKYPDLVARGDSRIDKEIVTTAIGLKTAEIFEDEAQQSKWLRWLLRFLRALKAKFGIESSAVLALSERLVSGQELQTKEKASPKDVKEGIYRKGLPSLYQQNSKKLSNTESLVNKMIKAENEIQAKAVIALQRKYDTLSKKGKDTGQAQELSKLLERIQMNNPTKALVHMLRFAVISTKEMTETYDAYIVAERAGKQDVKKEGTPLERKMSVKLLTEWRNSVASWDMLEDLRTLYAETKRQVDVMGTEADKAALNKLLMDNKPIIQSIIGEKKYKEITKNKKIGMLDLLIPLLDEVIQVKNEMQKIYIEKGKELITDFLLPFTNHVRIQHTEKYQREYGKLTEDQKKATTMEEYVNKKLSDNLATIEAETKALIMQELEVASSDVGFITRYLDTILDSRDVISSALAMNIFSIQEKTNREVVKIKYEFMDRIEKLEKQQGRSPSMPDEKFWDWLIETDPETGRPRQHIISDLPSKLIEDYYNKSEEVWSDTYKTNSGKKPTSGEKFGIMQKWLEENAPRDREAYYKAHEELADQMKAAKLITEAERKAYLLNSKLTERSVKKPLNKLFKNSEAVDMVDGFERRSYWKYRKAAGYYQKINSKWYAFEEMRKKGLVNGVQTDERVLFYDFLQDKIEQAASKIPGKYALSTELPSMMKDMGQRYRASAILGVSVTDFLKQEMSRRFTNKASDTNRGMQNWAEEELNVIGKEKKAQAEKDKLAGLEEGKEKQALIDEQGNPIYYLPIYYTQNKARKYGDKMEITDQSFDIGSIYFNYVKMAVDFGNKYEKLAEIEMTNYFINNREVIKRDSDGKVVTDATKNKLAKVGESIRKRVALDDGNKSMLAAQTADFLKSMLYGMEHEEEPDFTLAGLTINRAKALDALNGYTALNLLGVNFVAGFANLNLGEITQFVESFAGQYTTIKDLNSATAYYYKNLGGIMRDIGVRRPHNIVSLLNDRFNTLNEEVDGKINLNSRFANMMKTNTLFFTSHAGEHYMQTRFMLAMLKTLQARDENGKALGSMLDFISVDDNGELKIDEKVKNFTEEDQIKFSAKMHRVLSSMHGEYTKLGQNALQRYALGRMAILFRRFVVPGFKRRWEKKGINNLLGDYTEGYYRTAGRLGVDVVKQFMVDYMHFKFEAMEAFGRKGKDALTPMEKANLIRVTGEMTALLVSIIMVGVIMRWKDADDDKDNVWLNNLAYQALRLRSELSFFFNPQATMQILRSPMAAMSMLENSMKLAGQLMYPVWSGTFGFEVYEQGSWKGHLKLEKTVNNLLPVYKQWYRIQDIGDQLSWFKQ